MTRHPSSPHALTLLLALALGVACGGEGGTNEAEGSAGGGGGPPFDMPTYIQATRECRPPLAGEPPGKGEGGQVCTWQSVAGATEENRSFRAYADCGVVRTQRPYYPQPPSETYRADDPRMADPAYASELAWAQKQIDAVGCSCCHSNAAPDGPVRWSIDLPGNWVSSMNDRDVALLANWLDTSMFEKYPAEINNGFARPHGIPSTDPARLEAFFLAEANHRGLTPAQFEGAPPTGGPLLEQQAYVPTRCGPSEGVDAEGTITWSGGPARYVYVLKPGSQNPTVPPDRDTPAGTLWRLDVPSSGQPLAPGSIRYGVVPPGTAQHAPADGAPAPLEAGRDYYLYVTRDMYQPITRCLFTVPG